VLGSHHPGGDVHCHPANVVVASLDLADVQPGPSPNVDAAKLVPRPAGSSRRCR
jgi:hypothetical protein